MVSAGNGKSVISNKGVNELACGAGDDRNGLHFVWLPLPNAVDFFFRPANLRCKPFGDFPRKNVCVLGLIDRDFGGIAPTIVVSDLWSDQKFFADLNGKGWLFRFHKKGAVGLQKWDSVDHAARCRSAFKWRDNC